MADRIPPGGVPDVTFLCAGGPKTAPASGGAGLVIVAGEQVAGPSQSLLASRLRIAPELARRILWLAGARPAPVGGLILAGGRSARMGRDKVFLPAGGSTLTAGLHAALGRLCDEVIVVTSRARAAHFDGLRTVVDEQPDQGPLMAIASGLAAARHERNLVVACDIPTLDAALMARLLAESEDHQIVIPSFRDGGKQPLFGVYRKEVLGTARDLLGQGWRRPDDLLRACRSRIIPVASDDWYMNLNTPADYHAFLRRQAAGGPSAAG
jgi:molybdopterin-guanine dinucleotide biosynthesis protein A